MWNPCFNLHIKPEVSNVYNNRFSFVEQCEIPFDELYENNLNKIEESHNNNLYTQYNDRIKDNRFLEKDSTIQQAQRQTITIYNYNQNYPKNTKIKKEEIFEKQMKVK